MVPTTWLRYAGSATNGVAYSLFSAQVYSRELLSAVRELGQLTQVPTPFTDALLGLSRLHARVRGLYPDA